MFGFRLFSRSRVSPPQPQAPRFPTPRELGPKFYEAWLGRRMVYSCGYYAAGLESLDEAQEAKLDYVCRKLRLQAGERFLDLGCGWGGLMEFAAEHYGVETVGVTRSQREATHVAERMAVGGRGARCTVQALDYRELRGCAEFDKIASIEMFDQLGRMELPGYFTRVYEHLRSGGLFLAQGVVAVVRRPAGRGETLARRLLWCQDAAIEPSITGAGELAPLAEIIAAAEAAGFETRDVESLREHYVLTMREWASRMASPAVRTEEIVGDRSARMWRTCLAASSHAFAARRAGAVQILLAKPHMDGFVRLPLTRDSPEVPVADAVQSPPKRSSGPVVHTPPG